MLEFNIATPHDNFNYGKLSCLINHLDIYDDVHHFFIIIISSLLSYKSKIISFRSLNQGGIHGLAPLDTLQ